MKRLDFSHILSHTIRGKVFRLIWRKPPGKHPDPNQEFKGQCDSPHDKGRELWLWPKQDAKDMLGTVIHECAHGAFWDLDEAAVEAFERDTMRLLTRMGIEVAFKNNE